MSTVTRRRARALFLAVAWCATSAVQAAVATFDNLTEGFYGSDLVNGGIHLFDPDYYLPGEIGIFAIDQADGNLGDDPFFSPPNGMGLNGYSPGPIGGGSRFGSVSFELADGRQGMSATVDVWINLLDGANKLILAAYAGEQLIDFAIVGGPINCCDVHKRLRVGGQPFDTIRLFGVGTFENGAAFLLVDNVRIRPCTTCGGDVAAVPVPGALWLLGSALGVAPWAARRRRAAAARECESA